MYFKADYVEKRNRRKSRSEDEGIDISSDVTDKMDVGHATDEQHVIAEQQQKMETSPISPPEEITAPVAIEETTQITPSETPADKALTVSTYS